MTAISPTPSRKYDLNFARWVFENVDGGDRLNKCMQCGTCSGSCPIGDQMDYGPRKLFMMIRAGMKEAVLTSNTLWNCVSCYNCVVRCPRQVPVTYILHNARFAKAFWWSAAKWGKTDERLVTAKYYFSFGFGEGLKKAMANQKIAMAMVKTKRMHLGMPHKVKNTSQLKAILAKAAEIDAQGH